MLFPPDHRHPRNALVATGHGNVRRNFSIVGGSNPDVDATSAFGMFVAQKNIAVRSPNGRRIRPATSDSPGFLLREDNPE